MPADEVIQKADKLHKADQTARKALRIQDPVAPNSIIQLAVLVGGAERHNKPPAIEQD